MKSYNKRNSNIVCDQPKQLEKLNVTLFYLLFPITNLLSKINKILFYNKQMLNKEKKDTISSLTSNSTRACLILGNNVTYLMKKSSYLSTENELLLRKEPVVCGCMGVWVCVGVGVCVCVWGGGGGGGYTYKSVIWVCTTVGGRGF